MPVFSRCLLGLLTLLLLLATEDLPRTLMAGLVKGMRTLVWTVILLMFVLYILAFQDPYVFAQEYFGSIPRSMMTLFQIMTLESWRNGIVRPRCTEGSHFCGVPVWRSFPAVERAI